MPWQPTRFGKQAAPRKPWQPAAGVEDRRIRGRAGQRQRQRVLREEPLCRSCRSNGLVAESVEVDHIIPLSQGGSSERSNLQGLCVPCHAAKTKAEHTARRQ